MSWIALTFPHQYHRQPSQSRAEKTIQDILQAAVELMQQGDPERLSARELSRHSGYAIGSIYYHFQSIERIFVQLFEQRRDQNLRAMAEAVRTMPDDATVEQLMQRLTDIGFGAYARPNPKVLALVLRLYFRHAKSPERFGMGIDILAQPLLELQRSNRSGTLRSMGLDEIRLSLRAVQAVIRAPYLESDPIAGSPLHRQFALASCVRLFGVA